MSERQLDSTFRDSSYFSGVILVRPQGLLAYDLFELYEQFTPRFYYYHVRDKKILFVDEFQYFNDSSEQITDIPFYSKIHDPEKPGDWVEKRFNLSRKLETITTTTVQDEIAFSAFLHYDKSGRLFSQGSYVNDMEQGEFPTYHYNDSILFTEIWTKGFLTGVKDERVIFVGEKNKVISQKEYFEIIKSQKGIQWNILAIPATKLKNEHNKAFIMYSELLDFMSFYDKHWEEDKYVDIVLKRYEKYLMKMEN